MPQMAPIWWSTMFIIIMATYLLTMMIMYFFNINKKNPVQKMEMEKNLFHWKW